MIEDDKMCDKCEERKARYIVSETLCLCKKCMHKKMDDEQEKLENKGDKK